jgi:hypothetical protein
MKSEKYNQIMAEIVTEISRYSGLYRQ